MDKEVQEAVDRELEKHYARVEAIEEREALFRWLRPVALLGGYALGTLIYYVFG